MKKLILILTTFLTFNANAAQVGDTYGGFQYVMGTYSEDGFPDANPKAISLRLGKFIKDDFAIEGRFGFGMGNDAVDIFGITATVEVDTLIGVYGIGHVRMDADKSIYGAFGFSQGGLTLTGGGVTISDDDSGLSFGAGINIGNVNIEFMQYLNKSDFDFSAISIGVMF